MGTLITPQDIPDPTKQLMIQNLFGVFALPGSTENEYAMKAIMRTLSLLQVGGCQAVCLSNVHLPLFVCSFVSICSVICLYLLCSFVSTCSVRLSPLALSICLGLFYHLSPFFFPFVSVSVSICLYLAVYLSLFLIPFIST